ncbi:D-Ala-D-Ala carboxypeptidase family metallohydrolase [Kaarinaea lacus]
MVDLEQQITPNFKLGEFLRSDTAERHPEILEQQYNPPQEIIDNITWVVTKVLQPIRESFNYPMRISSGYRSEALNEKVGGSPTSQHRFGQAVDCGISDSFLTSTRSEAMRRDIDQLIIDRTGKPVRGDVNANFYLFAYVCLRLQDFDIDQVIHEYGTGRGKPAWVHIASSPGDQAKLQILGLGRYFSGNKDLPDLTGALSYGT